MSTAVLYASEITAATGKMNQILRPFRPIQQTKSRDGITFFERYSLRGWPLPSIFLSNRPVTRRTARMHSCSPERLFSSGAITLDSFRRNCGSRRIGGARAARVLVPRCPVLTAEPYFFRLHTNRVFIRRNTTPSLVSVDLSKFSAE